MSRRKILLRCSLLVSLCTVGCREEKGTDDSLDMSNFFSEVNAPGIYVLPDVVELELERPVFTYASTITSEFIPMDELVVDDAMLMRKLTYYGATGVKEVEDGVWQVSISKYCHYVLAVVKDFSKLDVVAAAKPVATGFGFLDVVPRYRENGNNVMAPRVRVSLEDGPSDACQVGVWLQLVAGEPTLFRPQSSRMWWAFDEPVTNPSTAETGCHYYGNSEAPGTYAIDIKRDGYVPQTISNVEIVLDDNLCHVVQQEFKVTLKKK